MELKICNQCFESKPLSEYWVSRKGRTHDGYKSECKDCAKARRRAWSAKNRDREAYHNRKKYEADPQRYIDASREWARINPERARELHRINELNRRARKRDQFIEEVDPRIVYEMHGGMCGICEQFVPKDDFHVDHVVPLARGGMHGYINVQPAHPLCNRQKWARV